jgi:hypothetical protein
MMCEGITADNDHVRPDKHAQPHYRASNKQEQFTISGLQVKYSGPVRAVSNGKTPLDSPSEAQDTIVKTAETPKKTEIQSCSGVSTYTETSIMSSSLNIPRGTPSYNAVDSIIYSLEKVHKYMDHFSAYIKTQKEQSKPLYHWEKYGGYPALSTAVSKLEESITKFKSTRLHPDYLASSVAHATDSSTAVSRAAVCVLAVVNKKIAEYMDDMESSTLNENSKAQANKLITFEVQKLMEHSTRATEQVWRATDLLRECKERRTFAKDWAWSVAATIMTSFIAATVAILITHLYGSMSFDMGTARDFSNEMYHQVLDLVQYAQVVTSLTGEIYNIKLQDIDKQYNDLADISKSHGLRIDNIVDSLGPPNSEGTYYLSTPQTNDTTCEGRIQTVSRDLALQMKRQKEDMELMRKDMHRMNIRLTRGIDKVKKNQMLL